MPKSLSPSQSLQASRWEFIALAHWDDRIRMAISRANEEYIAAGSPPVPLSKYDYRREAAKKPRKAKKGVLQEIAKQLSAEVHGRLDIDQRLKPLSPIQSADGETYFNAATVDGRKFRVILQEVDNFSAIP